MTENTISINAIDDVTNMVKSAIRNGYTVIVKPVYELYWKSKIDHFDITFIDDKEDNESR